MVAEKEELVQEGSGEPLGEIDYILVSGRTAAGEGWLVVASRLTTFW